MHPRPAAIAPSFHTDVFPELKTKYVDTGKVRFVFREFPLDNLAVAAFMLARCAGDDRYFPMVGALFETQKTWAVPGADAKDKLLLIAKQAGISQEQFDKCLADKELFGKIVEVRQRGHEKFGVEFHAELLRQRQAHAGRPQARRLRGRDRGQACGDAAGRRDGDPRAQPLGMKLRLLTASILLATACGVAACGGGAVGSADTKALNVPAKEELLQEGPLGDRVIGKPSAPVTIIEYASLTCPHCRAYHRDVFPRVKKRADRHRQGALHRPRVPDRALGGDGGDHHALRTGGKEPLLHRAIPGAASRNG